MSNHNSILKLKNVKGPFAPPPPPSHANDWENNRAGDYVDRDIMYIGGANLLTNLLGTTSCHLKNLDNVTFVYVPMKERNKYRIAVANRGWRGGVGVQLPPPPEIPNFWQSQAELPVPWKIHSKQPNKNTGFTHLQIERNPWLWGYRPQIPVLSALCPQLNLLTPTQKKNSWAHHCIIRWEMYV
jgi:hypothetical protein